jgi:hypothetical protein
MQFIQTARLILSLLPLILEAVKAVEAALPEGGLGAQKLGLVRQTLQAAFDIADDGFASFEKIWPALEKTVTAVVGVFNTAGVFPRK